MKKLYWLSIVAIISSSMLLTGCGFLEKNNKLNQKDKTEYEVSESTEEIEVEGIETEGTETETEMTTTENLEQIPDSEKIKNQEQQSNQGQQLSQELQKNSGKKPSQEDVQIPPQEDFGETIVDRYIVGYNDESESAGVTSYKYGVTMEKVIHKQYALYNDGSKDVVGTWEGCNYDTSTYNATDEQLKAESIACYNLHFAYYQEVLTLVNQIRAEEGVAPLTLDTSMCYAASMRAMEMDYANYFEHARADGRSWDTALDFFGISRTSWGENIAAGQRTPQEVVTAWKNSPGHYANMIDSSYTKLGVGYFEEAKCGDYGVYWVQLFAN